MAYAQTVLIVHEKDKDVLRKRINYALPEGVSYNPHKPTDLEALTIYRSYLDMKNPDSPIHSAVEETIGKVTIKNLAESLGVGKELIRNRIRQGQGIIIDLIRKSNSAWKQEAHIKGTNWVRDGWKESHLKLLKGFFDISDDAAAYMYADITDAAKSYFYFELKPEVA